MNLGAPVWNGRISPVFEAAQRLLVIAAEEGKETARTEADLGNAFPPHRVSRLLELEVAVLICGAVSQSMAAMVAGAGIRLIPFVAGDVDDVVGAYLAGGLPGPQFMMPGCRRGRQRRFRSGRRG